MEEYIVRIRTFYADECVSVGTGIVIAPNLVLTAEHVACGDRHTVIIDGNEITADIVTQNNTVVILQIADIVTNNVVEIFTDDEILDEEAEWEVQGYITQELAKHKIQGLGLVEVPIEDAYWDYELTKINAGGSKNYSGLSGSPVFCNNRIVGILQMQTTAISGILGLRMSSVSMFKKFLEKNNIKGSEYKNLLKTVCSDQTIMQLERNIKSKKYIADIFVEESLYKEQIRCFADPKLFLRKAIIETKMLKFKLLNELCEQHGERQINFQQFDEGFKQEEIGEVFKKFMTEIIYAERTMQEAEGKYYVDQHIKWEEYYNVKQRALNNSMKWAVTDIKENIKYLSKRYLLLTKDAGQGKTNFLCDFTDNFLIRKNYFVLYFNAYDFQENPIQILQRKLRISDSYDLKYVCKSLESEYEKTLRPFIVIIDGLNENASIKNFGLAMKEFLEECSKYPFIKVIMTTRNELLEERFSAIEEGIYKDYYERIDMKSKSDEFKERIFEGYLSFFNITVRDGALSERAYEKLTKDMLLLRFFCEVNENKKEIYLYDVYTYEVFKEYIKRKAIEYSEGEIVLDNLYTVNLLLDKIAKYMIEKKEFLNVPIETFDLEENKLLVKMLNNEVVFKDRKIIQKGMLNDETTVISFTFDEFRDFNITNYVLKNLKEKEFLEFWRQVNKENYIIKEGVNKYIFFLARTETEERILPLLVKQSEYEDLYWKHIWELDDKYKSENDCVKFKEQLIMSGQHDKKVIFDLILKYDIDSFPNINIELLFSVLDEMALEINKYERFIKRMFGVSRKSQYYYLGDEPISVWPYNQLLDNLEKYICSNDWNKKHKQIYKLTTYLLELESWQTICMWEKLYKESPKLTIEVISEMNNHKSSYINGNIKEILENIRKVKREDGFGKELELLYISNNFCENIGVNALEMVSLIWGEIDEDF